MCWSTSTVSICPWSVGRCWRGAFERQDSKLRLLGLVLVGVLAALSWQRNTVWRDELSLWSDAAQKSPAMPRAQVHLGNALSGRTAGGGRQSVQRGIRLDPQHRAAHQSGQSAFRGGQRGRFESVSLPPGERFLSSGPGRRSSLQRGPKQSGQSLLAGGTHPGGESAIRASGGRLSQLCSGPF